MTAQTDHYIKQAEAGGPSEKQMRDYAAENSVNYDFYSAGLTAFQSARQDGLLPNVDEFGELSYSVQQGLKAACHARQDVAGIALIQLALLRRLQNLKSLAWACLLILIYIAFRIS